MQRIDQQPEIVAADLALDRDSILVTPNFRERHELEGDLESVVMCEAGQLAKIVNQPHPFRIVAGNEDEARAYGDDPRRDMAGIFERIAPFVWRLVIPYPRDGSQLQVFELKPVPEQPKG